MGMKYSSFKSAWVPGFGPASTINESEFGYDHSTIYFPGVKSCTAVIAKLQLGLCGIHLTIAENDAAMAALLEKMAARAGGRASAIVLVGSTNSTGQGCVAGSPYRMPGMAATLKQQLSGGGAGISRLDLPSIPGHDVRATVSGGGVAIATRAVATPFAPGDGWVDRALVPL